MSEAFVYQLIEELFRYLYLIARSSDNKSMDFAPSKIVAKSLHCLLLDPVTYYQVCDALLTLAGSPPSVRPLRVLPHNPLCTESKIQCNRHYKKTFQQYGEQYTNGEPPEDFWPAPLSTSSTDSQHSGSESEDSGSLVGFPFDESRFASKAQSRLPSRPSSPMNIVNME
jgi:hypothetical protein